MVNEAPSLPVKPGRVRRVGHITRAMVQADRETLFVFGDNMERRGLGGQAAAMRGEPNAIGVPTKWHPERTASAYFTDADWPGEVRREIVNAFARIERALLNGHDVATPADGLGTGLAELPKRAPRIHRYIEDRIALLSERSHGH